MINISNFKKVQKSISHLSSDSFSMKKLYSLFILFVFASCSIVNAQIDPFESKWHDKIAPNVAVEVIQQNTINKIEYDRCEGVLKVAMEATKNGSSGQRALKMAMIYVKVDYAKMDSAKHDYVTIEYVRLIVSKS